jgi:hypothetical protein
MSADTIARLKITLDDVKPTVLRWIDVPLTIRLDRLHLAIQAAMGWTNTHLYEIRAGDVGWGDPDPDGGDGPLDARKARLIDVLEDVGTKTLRYLYDFGDGWEHTIKVERLLGPVPGIVYPQLIDAAGRCPPEDIGGPWGYAELLEALGDPRHEPKPAIGSKTALIPPSLMPIGLPKNSPRWRNAGRENLRQSARALPNPRYSAEGYADSARSFDDRGTEHRSGRIATVPHLPTTNRMRRDSARPCRTGMKSMRTAALPSAVVNSVSRISVLRR